MHMHNESQHVKFVSKTANLMATETNIKSIFSEKTTSKGVAQKYMILI
jgi:hypothetical protein